MTDCLPHLSWSAAFSELIAKIGGTFTPVARFFHCPLKSQKRTLMYMGSVDHLGTILSTKLGGICFAAKFLPGENNTATFKGKAICGDL